MNKQVEAKEYIPDSSHAEKWVSEDVFVWKGMRFRIMPDGEVVKVRRNGKSKRSE